MTRVTLAAFFFFFNDTATTEIYTLSLHDALPIWRAIEEYEAAVRLDPRFTAALARIAYAHALSMYWGWDVPGVLPESVRSEEHTSELQSQSNLVCRLLLEKKNKGTQ